MSDSSPKTPWFMRFALGAILRKSGLTVLAPIGIATLLMTSHTEQTQAQTSSTNRNERIIPTPTLPAFNQSSVIIITECAVANQNSANQSSDKANSESE